MATTSFTSACVLLFLVADPLGNLPIFVSQVRLVSPERRLRFILREVSVAFIVLMLFMRFGSGVLRVMHLSQTSLGIAGGVILFLIAVRMVFPQPEGHAAQRGGEEPYVVPIAIPSLAGPSALATVLLLGSREPDRIWIFAGALGLIMLSCGVTLGFADRIARLLGEQVTTAFERLMGLILTAVAAEMLLGGIREYVATLPK